MCTVRLPIIRASVLRPQVNKFKQVSSDGHKMSLAEGWGLGVWGGCTVRPNASRGMVT